MTQSVYNKFRDVVSINESGSDRQNEMVGPLYSTGPSHWEVTNTNGFRTNEAKLITVLQEKLVWCMQKLKCFDGSEISF